MVFKELSFKCDSALLHKVCLPFLLLICMCIGGRERKRYMRIRQEWAREREGERERSKDLVRRDRGVYEDSSRMWEREKDKRFTKTKRCFEDWIPREWEKEKGVRIRQREGQREREKKGDVWCIDSMRLWKRRAKRIDKLREEWIMGFALLKGFF